MSSFFDFFTTLTIYLHEPVIRNLEPQQTSKRATISFTHPICSIQLQDILLIRLILKFNKLDLPHKVILVLASYESTILLSDIGRHATIFDKPNIVKIIESSQNLDRIEPLQKSQYIRSIAGEGNQFHEVIAIVAQLSGGKLHGIGRLTLIWASEICWIADEIAFLSLEVEWLCRFIGWWALCFGYWGDLARVLGVVCWRSYKLFRSAENIIILQFIDRLIQ